MSSYSFVPFNGRVDDTILAIKRNNIEIDPVSIGYNISKHTQFQEMNFPDLEVGDLVTITVFNVHSMAGILYETTIGGVNYDCSQSRCSSNSSKSVTTYFGIYGFFGEYHEIHDFYFQISNNLAYPGYAFRLSIAQQVTIFKKYKISRIDQTIDVNKVKILLLESLQYGTITDNNNNALSNQKDAIISIDNIEYINYKPNSNTFSVIDHFTFKLFVDSKYSPMTIISIVICDEGCSACDENFVERAIEKKECYECRANYYGYKKRCYSQCPKDTYKIEASKSCTEICPDDYSYYNTHSKECVNACPSDFYVYNKHCYIDKCPAGTFTLGYTCYDSCLSPYLYYLDTCVTSCPSGTVQYENYCYSSCPEGKFLISALSLCVEQCDTEPYIIYNKLNDNNLQCVTSDGCPEKYIPKNGECTYFIETNTDSDSKFTTDLNKDTILNDFIEILPSDVTIKGDDFIFQSFPAEQEMTPSDGASAVDFSSCINTLKQHPQYANCSFTIVKFDLERENSTIKQVEYKLLDENGTEVNLELCANQTIEIKYTLDPNTPGVDFDKIKEFADKGIDIFNPDSPFFSDICVPYTSSNGTDIPLKDRRKDMMQNISLCEAGCEYKSFNVVTYEVSCDCNVKGGLSFDENPLEVPSFKTLVDSTNIKILKCYKLLLDIDNYLDNIGFFIYLGVLLLLIMLIVIYYTYSYKEVLKMIFDYPLANPSSVFIVSKISTKERSSISDSTERTLNEKSQIKFEEYTSKELKEKYSEKEDENINMDESPYSVASEKDKRGCNIMFWDLFLSKIDFISILFYPGKYDVFVLNISLYLFMLSLEFAMNSLLFTDDVISQNYQNGGHMSFATSFILSFISRLLTSIVGFSFVRLSKFAPYFEVVDKEIKDEKNFMLMCRKILRTIRVRIIMYYVLEILFVIAFLYYITIFCIVYHNNQMKWLTDCVMGIMSDLFFTLILSIGCTIVRFIGIKTQSKNLYNIARYSADKFI